ncbi:hypothetical protein Q0Z83_041530 [Actinoplanes sichuanensis]|nr:hypothetical protein Q0Z83_041530 [Actinoplanes sichuanensis]
MTVIVAGTVPGDVGEVTPGEVGEVAPGEVTAGTAAGGRVPSPSSWRTTSQMLVNTSPTARKTPVTATSHGCLFGSFMMTSGDLGGARTEPTYHRGDAANRAGPAGCAPTPTLRR